MRQEPHKMKLVGREPACRQSRYYRAGSRHRFDPKPCGYRRLYHSLAGIADARTARICNQRNLFSTLQPFQEFLASLGFVKFKITQKRLRNPEMLQQ